MLCDRRHPATVILFASVLAGLSTTPGAGLEAGSPVVVTAAQAAALQSQDTNVAGVVAEVTECKRQDGVLTIKVRLKNTSAADVAFSLIQARNYDHFYVTAGGKKYFVLRDSDKTPIAVLADNTGALYVKIPKGGAYTWWAKYPAPPADQTKVNYVMPIAPPFEDVPISQ